jgi:predicted ATP-dependent protease
MTPELELQAEQLFRRTAPAIFDFDSTATLPPLRRVIGQERAVQAIDFGVEMPGDGYNIFAVGSPGSGRSTAVRQFLDQHAAERPAPLEWCYVYNFEDARAPRAVSLPPGRAAELRNQMARLVERLREEIPRTFEGQPYEDRRRELLLQMQQRQQALFEELERYLNERHFALIRSQAGLAIAPMLNSEVLTAEAYQKLDPEIKKRYEAFRPELQEQFDRAMREARNLDREGRKAIENINNEIAGFVVDNLIAEVREAFADCDKVVAYLHTVRDDVVANVERFVSREEESSPLPMPGREGGERWFRRYEVNVLTSTPECVCAPVVLEDNPTYHRLVGRIEHRAEFGAMVTDFTQIRAGALHAANGGYLVLEARQLLTNQLSWEALKRALRNHEIKIEEMAQFYGLVAASTLEPEPIPLDVKVVLIGDPQLYGLLAAYDEDLRELFKVKAEFVPEIKRNDDSLHEYARFVGELCRREGLRHLDASGVARLVDEASRLVADQNRITARFSAVADIVREAAFWAGRAGRELVAADDIARAVRERRQRLDYAAQRYRENITDGTVLIDTVGAVVGQINGLSVAQTAEFMFGLPSRVTARTYLGRAGVVSIDREVKMTGPIHDKGQLILSSYLAGRFAQQHSLSLAASLTFEQSYGGVEGDSASSTELYALLSSLAEAPIKQNLAVTGSVNQFGQVQAIGGVNAKIEGFFDLCRERGLTGDQGVLIPAANVQHLMLRDDVVAAVAEGQFHIYAVATIEQGIELLTGLPAGEANDQGDYPDGTIYAAVQRKLSAYREALQAEAKPRSNGANDAEPSPEETPPEPPRPPDSPFEG